MTWPQRLLSLVWWAASAAQLVQSGGPASHEAHAEAVARIQRLEATVLSLLLAHDEAKAGDRRGLQGMDGMQGGGMQQPPPPPTTTGDGMDGMDMDGDGQAGAEPNGDGGMGAMDMGSSPMHVSLFFFAGASGQPLVVVWSWWEVTGFAGYAATLVVLMMWAVLHEWLARSIRPAVSAASGQRKRSTKAEAGALGMGLMAGTSEMQSPEVGAGKRLTMRIGGMTCDGCAARIQSVLTATDGVLSADVSFGLGTAVVQHTTLDGGLLAKVSDIGYEAEVADAPQSAVPESALPPLPTDVERRLLGALAVRHRLCLVFRLPSWLRLRLSLRPPGG